MPARDRYSANSQQLHQYSELLACSSSAAGTMRSIPTLPTPSSGFSSSQGLDSPQPANITNGFPPLSPTELLYQNIQTTGGQPIRPEIIGKFGKGLFLAENDWTCYRRNYLQISCSYTLHPSLPAETIMHLMQGGHSTQIQAFAMSISSVVDGDHGKPNELVQHTPKREKGPLMRPGLVVLLPHPLNTTLYNGNNADGTLSSEGRLRFRSEEHTSEL